MIRYAKKASRRFYSGTDRKVTGFQIKTRLLLRSAEIGLLGVLALGLEDGRHLFALPLGPEVRADALLQELEAALVLRDLQQLHGATLVGGKSGK